MCCMWLIIYLHDGKNYLAWSRETREGWLLIVDCWLLRRLPWMNNYLMQIYTCSLVHEMVNVGGWEEARDRQSKARSSCLNKLGVVIASMWSRRADGDRSHDNVSCAQMWKPFDVKGRRVRASGDGGKAFYHTRKAFESIPAPSSSPFSVSHTPYGAVRDVFFRYAMF